MPCENYREALIEAAAEAEHSALPRELRAHLDVCPSCRATFTEELQLFTAIDTGLRGTANAEVPASLLPRVRAELNERPVARHTWIPIGAVMAAAFALVAVIIFARGLGSGPAGVNRDVNSLAHNAARAVIQAASLGIAPVEKTRKTAKHEPLRPARKARVAQAEELTVLIPEGQKQAIDALLSIVRQGNAKANILLAEEAEGSLNETRVAPLVISPIELKPLADLSAAPPSEDGNTRR